MTPDDIKREREQLEAAISARQRQIDKANTLASCAERDEPRRYVDYTRNAQGVVNKSMPASAPQPSHGFTAREMALLEAVMHAVGKEFAEERQKAHDNLQRVEKELRYALEHKADIKKLDRIVSEFRSELLTERLSSEREMRAMEQRYYRDRDRGMGAGSGGGVLDLKEIN